MNPEAAFDEKVRICQRYFLEAKRRSVKFCRRHLAQLEKQIDAKMDLDPSLASLFSYVYTRSIQINKDKNELEVIYPIHRLISEENFLLNLIPKETNPYHTPVTLSTDKMTILQKLFKQLICLFRGHNPEPFWLYYYTPHPGEPDCIFCSRCNKILKGKK